MQIAYKIAATVCSTFIAIAVCVAFQSQAIAGPIFDIHGAAKNCQDIVEVDRAFADEDKTYFAGWTVKDFNTAEEWVEACRGYGDREAGLARAARLQRESDLRNEIPTKPAFTASSPSSSPADKAQALAHRLQAENAAAKLEDSPAPQATTARVSAADRAQGFANRIRRENAAASLVPELPEPPPRAVHRAPAREAYKARGRDYEDEESEPDESDLVEHGSYVNVDGDVIHSPSDTVDGKVPDGATAVCQDGMYSFSRHRRGTCARHGGVATWLH